MKRYDVYGIGNALVDMEFEVDEKFLADMNIEKGLMTLVDQNRQEEIFRELSNTVPKMSCGGSAANTIVAVSQFGGESFYSCKVANDEAGQFYYKDLLGEGPSTNLSNENQYFAGKTQELPTGKCVVLITPDADRTMNTYLGITETFSDDELVEQEIKLSKFLYIEGYLVTSPTGRKAAINAKKLASENSVKTALTFSDPAMIQFFKEGLDEMLGKSGVDLLFCNENEALSYTNTERIEDALPKLKAVAKSFAITLGDKGAVLFDGQKQINIEGNVVEAIDTNGAGDLFAGAFLYAITQGKTFEQAGQLACNASAKLVTQFGARLQKKQVEAILQDTF
ncbi:MAG: adenosine kinase [Bacteriovoracaceae bacterium]|nr:adenosine kinase [Bacteriovoracaceae bacterium]